MQEDQADGDLKFRSETYRPEYGVRRSEIRRSESERGKGIDSEYRVYRSTERAEDNVTRYLN